MNEIVKSFEETCRVMILYYEELKKIIEKNKLDNTPKKMKIFLKKINSSNPIVKISSEKTLSRKDKDYFTKFMKYIKDCVVKDLNNWLRQNSHANVVRYINKNIKKYKSIVENCKDSGGSSNRTNKYPKYKDGQKNKCKLHIEDSDNESTDSSSEYDSEESDFEEESSEYTDSECDSEDEYDSDYVPEKKRKSLSKSDKSNVTDDELKVLFKCIKDGNKKMKSLNARKNKLDNDNDSTSSFRKRREKENYNSRLKKYLVERMNSSTTPLKKQISYFQELSNIDKKKIMDIIDTSNESNSPLMYRVMLSNLPKSIIHEMVERIGSLDKNEDECPKYREWVNASLKIPINKYTTCNLSKLKNRNNSKLNSEQVKTFLDKTKQCMDESVYGHNDAKQKILQFVAQNITNPKSKGLVLGIEGPMGNGKTTLIENGFAKALGRPFATIPLGGIQDGSFLEGHGYTYEGSRWGEIMNVLINTGCMNPIIYMDELDKVSQTHKGEEINNLLIHLTDPSQNCHFKDKYFTDINIDLSQVIFIFSYNDRDSINPILMDRITHLETRGFRAPEKLIICRQYLLKNILKDVGIKQSDIKFPDDIIEWIIHNYTNEGGVRQLKKICYQIVREINLRQLTDKKYNYPFIIKKKNLEMDILEKSVKHKYDKIHESPVVGKINGLYATCNDTGGLIQIEASFIPSDSEFKLQLTGNQGKVMQESMHVANTLAWNLIKDDIKLKLKEDWKESGRKGIHVHCPEGGVPKDGPSAGAAITTVMYSLLMGKKIRNKIAITGEIDLSGKIMAIGGLESKIFGAKNAGCERVICPKENEDTLKKILKEHPQIQTENFQIKMVSSIQEVLNIMLIK